MIWKIARLESNTRRMSKETAERHYAERMQRKVLTMFDHNKNKKMKLEMKYTFANSHHGDTLLKRAYKSLRRYTQDRKWKHAQYE